MSTKYFIWIFHAPIYLWEFSWNFWNFLSIFRGFKTFSRFSGIVFALKIFSEIINLLLSFRPSFPFSPVSRSLAVASHLFRWPFSQPQPSAPFGRSSAHVSPDPTHLHRPCRGPVEAHRGPTGRRDRRRHGRPGRRHPGVLAAHARARACAL
jgi:hypothetical protein